MPDPLIITLYGEPVLVMHGDALCTDDRPYQRLRATVRDADWQRRFLALSVAQRRALAGAARAGSRAHTAAIDYAIADVNAASSALALRGRRCQRRCCTDIRIGRAFILSRSTAAPARASCSATGTRQGSVLRWDASGPELRSLPRAL